MAETNWSAQLHVHEVTNYYSITNRKARKTAPACAVLRIAVFRVSDQAIK